MALSTSIEMRQQPKPKSPKPTGGLITWKSSWVVLLVLANGVQGTDQNPPKITHQQG